jgi:hypothetical protein
VKRTPAWSVRRLRKLVLSDRRHPLQLLSQYQLLLQHLSLRWQRSQHLNQNQSLRLWSQLSMSLTVKVTLQLTQQNPSNPPIHHLA